MPKAKSGETQSEKPVGKPSTGPRVGRKRKPRTAAQIRERKRARAAARNKATSKDKTTSNASSGEKGVAGAKADTVTGAGVVAAMEKSGRLGQTGHVSCDVAKVGGKFTKPGSLLLEVVRAARSEVAAASAAIEATRSTYSIVSQVVAQLMDRVENQVLRDSEPLVEDRLASAGLTLSDVEDGDEWACTVCTYLNSRAIVECWSCKCMRTEYSSATDLAINSATRIDPSATTTGHSAVAAHHSDAATDHECAATNLPASTEEICYPIYGKYYGSSKVTVDANYATTKKTWHVARICGRRERPLGTQCLVFWIARCPTNRRYYQRSWEPRAILLEDNFAEEMDLVDRWKASDEPKFEKFCRQDFFGKHSIGADMTGLCMFNALKRAAELADRPDIVTQQDIDNFVADELKYSGRDLTKGTSWKVVLRFLRGLRDDGRDFIFKAIEKDNFAIAGRRGARVLNELKLLNGIYLVAAYGHNFVGHCIVLTVQGKTRRIYDLQEGKPIASAKGWINFYAFIRPFITFTRK